MSTTFGEVLSDIIGDDSGRKPTKREVKYALEQYLEYYTGSRLFYLALEDMSGKVVVSPIFCTLAYSSRESSYMYEIAIEYGANPLNFDRFEGLYGDDQHGVAFHLRENVYVGYEVPLIDGAMEYFEDKPYDLRLCFRDLDNYYIKLSIRDYMDMLFGVQVHGYEQIKPCFVGIDSRGNLFVVKKEPKNRNKITLFDVLKHGVKGYRDYEFEG